jgi:hypothetical protein
LLAVEMIDQSNAAIDKQILPAGHSLIPRDSWNSGLFVMGFLQKHPVETGCHL